MGLINMLLYKFSYFISAPIFRLSRFMDNVVSTCRKNHQILGSIVSSLSVNMMNMLRLFKISFYKQAHDISVLKHSFSIFKTNHYISVLIFESWPFIAFLKRKIFPIELSTATFRTAWIFVLSQEFFIAISTIKKNMASPFCNRTSLIPGIISESPNSFGFFFCEFFGFNVHRGESFGY